ncbi:MAG: dihydroorotate dehydrogenase electron transfer subunit [Oscillospiraceae bacterium]|jgi:dihydroorotate dehydrogenase electron transfer subunit|nr:dihydroorotate dehydrogenase electron transfer subunit [Oscillospiraceae bacterium]
MTGEVLSISRLSDGVFDLRVGIALNAPAPGRFVHVAVSGFALRRPVSLCGYKDGIARLVLAVKGRGTAALAEMKPGERIDMLGALGNGFPPPLGKTLLVGGGIGLPPLLYYAGTYPGAHAIAGFRSPEQAVLAEEFPSVEVCFGDDYPHKRIKPGFDRVLACGPRPMLKAVAGVCARLAIPCFVSAEERMACGVGACLVCACAVGGRYRRVCKDGPVFDALDVDWSEFSPAET